MESMKIPRWLSWAREIQALAQTGSHYAENEYQRERYKRLSEIAAEIIDFHSTITYSSLLDSFQKQIGYATPKVDVRGAAFQDGQLLMVKERMDGGWTLPGGWADVGDIPSEAAEREVLEEAGFLVKARRVVGVYDANRIGPLQVFHAFKIIFLCDLIGGSARTSRETSEIAFFSYDEIPSGLSGERTKPHQIADVFGAHSNPDQPTVFD